VLIWPDLSNMIKKKVSWWWVGGGVEK